MKRNRVLLASIGICFVAAVAQAQGRGAPASNLQTTWWTDTALMTRLGLTDLQKSRIESTFQAYRPNLAVAKATLESEEAQLSRLLAAESINRSAVQLQINKVIQARAAMESVNAAMSLDMREQLTRAQWEQLQTLPPSGGRGGGGRGGVPSGAAAPDSFAAKYAADKPITLEGTVAEFKFEDPHSFVIFDVVGKDGRTTTWTGELAPATLLARQGWTATSLKPGERVTVQGAQAHDPSLNAVNIRMIRKQP